MPTVHHTSFASYIIAYARARYPSSHVCTCIMRAHPTFSLTLSATHTLRSLYPRKFQSTTDLLSLSPARRHPCPFAVEQLYGVNYSGRGVDLSFSFYIYIYRERGEGKRERTCRSIPCFWDIDRYVCILIVVYTILTTFLSCSLPVGPASLVTAGPVVQTCDRRHLRQDQGGD